MKKFEIPLKYRSKIISTIKEIRRTQDPRKKDYSPTELNFGTVTFYLARHFGFCYGVENAIEIAYTAIEENPGKRVYLLSEMIHNPGVNTDLISHGVQFLLDTKGNKLINWNTLTPDDVVIVPAFGTTIEIENKLKELNIDPYRYNTTCPFVEKVWKTAYNLGDSDFTVIIHGKHNHEETRATFSHTVSNAPSVIVRNIEEAKLLAKIILGELPTDDFFLHFKGKYSEGFDPQRDLVKIGVVNQTTMLATETEDISNEFKSAMLEKYGSDNLKDHYADTRDTLCYATNDNQKATNALLQTDADLAIVVGGYNSSNTSHIVELLEERFQTYFINSEKNIHEDGTITHWELGGKKEVRSQTSDFRSQKSVKVILTSGASCPDATIDNVMIKILSLFDDVKTIEDVLEHLTS